MALVVHLVLYLGKSGVLLVFDNGRGGWLGAKLRGGVINGESRIRF